MCFVWHGSPETPEHYENRLLRTECVCIPILNKHEQWHFHSTHISVHENIDRISGELGGRYQGEKRAGARARGGGRGRAVSVRYGSCPAAGGAERDGVDGRRRLSPTAGESSVEALPPGWAAWSRGLEGRMRCELKGPMGWAGPALVGLRAQAVDWDGWLAGCAFWPEPRNSLKFYFLFIRIFTINK